jgi:hypothetical protein
VIKSAGTIMKDIYILKIRGVNNMPDFIQIRDEKFTLIGYFRADKPERKRMPYMDCLPEEQLKEIIGELPYGRIRKMHIV